MEMNSKKKNILLVRIAVAACFLVGIIAVLIEPNNRTSIRKKSNGEFETRTIDDPNPLRAVSGVEKPLETASTNVIAADASTPVSKDLVDSRDQSAKGISPLQAKRLVTADLESYLSRAIPNPNAQQLMYKYLAEQRDKHHLDFLQEVDCRGWICKSTLSVYGMKEAKKLNRMDKPDDVQISYGVRMKDQSVSVNIYSTLPGSKFIDVINSSEKQFEDSEREAQIVASKLLSDRY